MRSMEPHEVEQALAELAEKARVASMPAAVIHEANQQLRDRVRAAVEEWSRAVGSAPSRVDVVMVQTVERAKCGSLTRQYHCVDVRTTLEI